MAIEGGPQARVRMIRKPVSSLHSLHHEDGQYHGIIAAAGAANGLISEVGQFLLLDL